jgi:hypothetical protein
MKKIIISTLCIMAMFSSCQNKKPENTTVAETPSISEMEAKKCFLSIVNQDTTRVSLLIDGDKITGEMDWIPFQKDKRIGTLVGKKNANGELELVYSFMQEGMSQTETKIMKVENDILFIKHGDLEDPNNDGNMRYTDVSKATFSEKVPKAVCE